MFSARSAVLRACRRGMELWVWLAGGVAVCAVLAAAPRALGVSVFVGGVLFGAFVCVLAASHVLPEYF